MWLQGCTVRRAPLGLGPHSGGTFWRSHPRTFRLRPCYCPWGQQGLAERASWASCEIRILLSGWVSLNWTSRSRVGNIALPPQALSLDPPALPSFPSPPLSPLSACITGQFSRLAVINPFFVQFWSFKDWTSLSPAFSRQGNWGTKKGLCSPRSHS